MARKGKFGEQATPSYATDVLKRINQMNATGETTAPAGTTDGTAPKVRREQKPLTAEQISANPLFSGKLSVDQAKINYIKAQQALNLMPSDETGSAYNSKIKKANAAIAKLGINPQESERQFFALGGQMQGVGRSRGANYGWSADKVIDYWRAAGMEDKGYEIAAKMLGTDRFGNPVEGGASQPTVDYRLGSDSSFNFKSPTKNLTALQAARLTKLKNLKQGKSTLSSRQLTNLKKLRAIAKG
jgi:hypothetical protein